jgi:hypothetical protein
MESAGSFKYVTRLDIVDSTGEYNIDSASMLVASGGENPHPIMEKDFIQTFAALQG